MLSVERQRPAPKFVEAPHMPGTLDILLRRWREGDESAQAEVVDRLYSELRRLAAHHFRHERPDHTLQPTAIVHELYLKLFSGEPVKWQDRGHFFAVASGQIRRILIDHARRRNARKRQDTEILWRNFRSLESPTRRGMPPGSALVCDRGRFRVDRGRLRTERRARRSPFGTAEHSSIRSCGTALPS